ncbi:MAG: hypothetical protein VYB54_16210 [Pseudomonadota bacterium]|nr:hypothetical protein [Pseudomonadota bacterium]
MRRFVLATAAVLGIAFSAQAAGEHDAAMQKLADTTISGWLADADLLAAIRAQNAANAGLDQAAIDTLDQTWRAETRSGSGPMSTRVLENALSRKLRGYKDAGQGLYTEIFVMDDRGLNVGQSDMTSDYWQGDEAKWQQTFGKGPGSVHISEVEFDESTQTYQSQLSMVVVDPETSKPIGAITIGVNVDALP